jgi:hypothetical protein
MTSAPKRATDKISSLSRPQSMMLGTLQDERGAIRALLTAPAVVVSDGQRHLGMVRDLSLSGVFFYTEFEPSPGSSVQLEITLTKDGTKTLLCRGNVVRVVRAAAGSALGVAVQAFQYELRVNQR